MIVKFKQFVNEALGVPNGIEESAEIIYDKILISFKKEFKKSYLIDNIVLSNDEISFEYLMDLNLNIGDLNLNKFKFKLNIIADDYIKNIELVSLSVGNSLEYIESLDKMLNKIDLPIEINIDILCNRNKYTNDLINYLEVENKNELLSAITHELMHIYDHYKYKLVPAKKIALDSTYTKLTNLSFFDIECVSRLFYDLYYISDSEMITRNAEVSSLLKSNKVNKKNFESFLKNTRAYKELLKIKKFSLSDFKSEIKKSEEKINEWFKYNKLEDLINLPIDKKVNMVLEQIRKIIETESALKYSKYVKSSTNDLLSKIANIRDILNLDDELISNDKIDKIEKFTKKHEYRKGDVDYFFGKIENIFHKKANYLIRKLYKLFDKAE